MKLPISPPFPPMEAQLVDEIPEGNDWQYEPKWDGFRCIVFRDGDDLFLQSKSGQPLARYFPELAEIFLQLQPDRFVIDGEIAIPVEERFSFDDLLQRIHPAASRVQKLAQEHPAIFIAFDLLVDERGKAWHTEPLHARRRALEKFSARAFKAQPSLRLSPASTDADAARAWLKGAGGDLDGVMAKRLDCDYRSGDRTGMEKVKLIRTADCVVGGFRYAAKQKGVGSLLLGLYEGELLHHVGFCSGLKSEERKALLSQLEPRIEPPGFTGRAPGGPSRWSSGKSTEWQPLKPELVVEVSYDHFTGGRFRHGTKLLRWRPDKAPQQCGMDQVERKGKGIFSLLE